MLWCILSISCLYVIFYSKFLKTIMPLSCFLQTAEGDKSLTTDRICADQIVTDYNGCTWLKRDHGVTMTLLKRDE